MAQKRWSSTLAAAVIAASMCTAHANEPLYQSGIEKFKQRDLLGAGRDLAKLAPFDQPYGPHAQYLLARVHDLMNERPEASANYRGVIAWGNKNPNLGELPEYFRRAIFYNGVILSEQDDEKIPEAIEHLRKINSPESTLRIGLLQHRAKQYNEAIETLRSIREDARFGDQALWFTARAILAAIPATPEDGQREAQIKRAIDKLIPAAEKAGAIAATGSMYARLRRADQLLELGDAQKMLKQFAEAAATYAKIVTEAMESPIGGEELSQRAQQAMARQTGALELAGQYDECQKLAAEFEKRWPKSVLLGSVLFRKAESVYLQADTSEKLEAAIKLLEHVVCTYPEFEHISEARHAWACALYHLERYTEAADVLRVISEPERVGPLATTALMLADCLLRTLPPDNDDALSTGRMLQQAEQAQSQLLGFLAANPNHPEAPLANFKLGYCYQIMIANKKEGPYWEWPGKAWDCYNKVDAAMQGSSLAAAAVLERAKVIQRTGDTGRAEGELKRFLTEPLNKADCSREALYKLGGLWRLMGRPAEGAELLAKQLEQKDDSPLSRLMEYEYGLCLKDVGKRDDAKAVLSRLTESSDPALAANSRWRLAQIERERLTSPIDTAKLKLRRSRQPAATDAARKELSTAADAMRQWLDSQITPALAGITAREGESRLWYEYAWSFRALEDAATELEEPAPLFRSGSTDIDSVYAYRRSAEIGSLGNLAARESANFANLDLGEMLAQRNRLDEAMDAFSGVLYTGGQLRDIARARLRIAQCLLTKGDAQAAIRHAELIPRWSGRINGQGRYLVGEAYLHMNDTKRAIATFRVFLDDRNSLFAPEAADKALLRLGETLEQHLRHNEAVLAYELLLKKYPRSPLADEARARLIATKYNWAGVMSRPRSAM